MVVEAAVQKVVLLNLVAQVVEEVLLLQELMLVDLVTYQVYPFQKEMTVEHHTPHHQVDLEVVAELVVQVTEATLRHSQQVPMVDLVCLIL
jgi:hypothetical protein